MQFHSDLLRTKVIRPKIVETTALGAAYLAGLAVGYWSGIDEIMSQWQVDQSFEPSLNEEKVKELAKGWEKAMGAVIHWSME